MTDAIWANGTWSVKVVLYACSCGAPGGYAYNIAKNLNYWVNEGLDVFGHPSVGHSFTNPMVRRFPSSKGETGETLCPAGKVDEWKAAMHEVKDAFWAKIPFMTQAEIDAGFP